MLGQIKATAPNSVGIMEPSVSEEAFLVYLDPSNNHVEIKDPKDAPNFTVEVCLEAGTAFIIASRTETCYTAWLKGMPIWTEGESPVRDINAIDDILDLYYGLMQRAGHDVAGLFQGAIV